MVKVMSGRIGLTRKSKNLRKKQRRVRKHRLVQIRKAKTQRRRRNGKSHRTLPKRNSQKCLRFYSKNSLRLVLMTTQRRTCTKTSVRTSLGRSLKVMSGRIGLTRKSKNLRKKQRRVRKHRLVQIRKAKAQ